MIRALLTAFVACLATLGARHAAATWLTAAPAPAVAAEERKLDVRPVKTLNVPVLKGGAIQGYLVVDLAFAGDHKALAALPTAPEGFVADEAFGLLYGDPSIDLARIETLDLDRFRHALVARVQARLRSEAVSDVLVREVNYVLSRDLR